MKIIITDSSVWIDLIQLNLLEGFFLLGYEFQTTQEIIDETKESKDDIQRIGGDKLKIIVSGVEEWGELEALKEEYPRLSFPDVSGLFHALKLQVALFSGDAYLRKVAESRKLEVHGTIYIIEQMKENGILSTASAIDALKNLLNSNARQPNKIINARIQVWSNEEKY